MTLSEMTAIAGVVSAFAVLVSLVFLNLQFRQTERNQRALIQQGRAGRTTDIVMRLMDSDFAEIYHRCMSGDTSITETQLGQFMGYCRAVFLGAEDSFLQHRDSLLHELAFASVTISLRASFISPGVRVIWEMTREWYEPTFVAFVDSIARESANHPRVDQLAKWKSIASEANGRRKAA